MMDIFNDEDDFLHSNPKDKFFEIADNANSDVVRYELEQIFDQFIAMENILEEKFGEEFLREIHNFIYGRADMETLRTGFYMDKMSIILSKSE
jgi:hypothetical protein